jgi:hypothetical protein
MPYFKDPFVYQQSASAIFEQAFKPGSVAPNSSIYRCDSCGFEVACAVGSALPSSPNCSSHGTVGNARRGLWLGDSSLRRWKRMDSTAFA